MGESRIIVSPKEIFPDGKREVEFVRELSGSLNCALVMPSEANTYSLAIEYMKEWYLDGFVDGFFKSVYINEKNLIDDFRVMSREQLIKRPKPCLSIVPRVEQDFNRDNLDLYNYGSNIYYNRARFKDTFFKDPEKKLFVGLDFEMKKIMFHYRAKVQTLTMAQNMAKHCKVRFRANGTQGKYVDLDILLPDSLIYNLAKDVGFEMENNVVKDNTAFLCYLNQHSQLPILYKFTTAVGRFQYYMKLPDMYMHIRTENVSYDDGERKGHTMMNYIVDFEAELLMPAPKFFAYYTAEEREFIKIAEPNANSYSLYSFPMQVAPKVNDKGWPQFITTNYEDDEDNFRDKKPVVIYFDDLVGDLRKVIDYTLSIHLSPSMFIDFKLFNEGKEVKLQIDWLKLTLSTENALQNIISYLVLYVDTNYLNTQIVKLKNEEDERITSYVVAKNVRSQ